MFRSRFGVRFETRHGTNEWLVFELRGFTKVAIRLAKEHSCTTKLTGSRISIAPPFSYGCLRSIDETSVGSVTLYLGLFRQPSEDRFATFSNRTVSVTFPMYVRLQSCLHELSLFLEEQRDSMIGERVLAEESRNECCNWKQAAL